MGRAGNILHRRGGRGDFQEAGRLAVQRIAYQGMADGCQMDSDLMRAARIRLTSNVVVLMVREITFARDLTVCHLGWRPTRNR